MDLTTDAGQTQILLKKLKLPAGDEKKRGSVYRAELIRRGG